MSGWFVWPFKRRSYDATPEEKRNNTQINKNEEQTEPERLFDMKAQSTGPPGEYPEAVIAYSREEGGEVLKRKRTWTQILQPYLAEGSDAMFRKMIGNDQ